MNGEVANVSRRQLLGALGCAGAVSFSPNIGWAKEAIADEPLPHALKRIEAEIDTATRDRSIASCSAALAVGGRLIWSYASGWADRERRIPATAKTIYPVASTSKPFTATGVLWLAERGRISLDRPINDYLKGTALPAAGGDPDQATVRRVLQHRAGIPTHGQFFYAGSNEVPPPMEEVIRTYGIVAEPPGRYVYSNLGYGILAFLTAQVSGKAYPQFMRDAIFKPLGLARTSVEIEQTRPAAAVVNYDGKGEPIPHYVFDEWGSGRVFTTVEDLVRFGLFHLGRAVPRRPVLSRQWVSAMVEDRMSTGDLVGPYGPDWFYGLGWGGRLQSAYGPLWYGHEGGMPGVSADLRLIPERDAVIAAASNSRSSLPHKIIEDLTKVLTPRYNDGRTRDQILAPPSAPASGVALAGTWRGEVRLPERIVPLRLQFDSGLTGSLQIGEAAPAQLRAVRISRGRLRADVSGSLVTKDLRPYPHHLEIDLGIAEGRLAGVIANAAEPPLYHFHLAHSATLTRV